MKQFAKFCAALVVLVLVFSLCTVAYADGSVTYNGDADQFIFSPGSSQSPTNLFGNFQNVMPGDTLTDQILVRNNTVSRIKLNVYLRSKGAQNDTEALLSQLKLTVKQADSSILFEAPANETAQLSDWVYLGTVYPGGQIKLDLSLEVPLTLGNEFQNSVGYIDWEFKVDEIPIKGVQTGDSGEVFLYSGLTLLSLAAIALLLPAAKRRKN